MDDDVVLNSFYHFKANLESIQNSILCPINSGSWPEKKKISKFYVKDSEYNSSLYGMERYPNYCNGPTHLMTADLAWKFYLKSFETKIFWINDVYFGILAM